MTNNNITTTFQNTKLNNYFMKPTSMSNGLLLYPISIYDYEEFRKLAMEYIVLDIKTRNNLAKQQFTKNKNEGLISKKKYFKKIPFDNLFDLLVNSFNQNKDIIEKIEYIKDIPKEDLLKIKEKYNHDIETMKLIEIAETNEYRNDLDNFMSLLEMVTKGKCNLYNNSFIISVNDDNYILDRNNFYEFRKIVMEQNILFEPKTSPQLEGQKQIDRDLEARNADSMECDLEAMIAFVSRKTKKDTSNFTYYRLMADFRSIMNEKNFDAVSRAFSAGNGKKGDKLPDITQSLGLNENPQDDEHIYKKLKNHEYESKLKQG